MKVKIVKRKNNSKKLRDLKVGEALIFDSGAHGGSPCLLIRHLNERLLLELSTSKAISISENLLNESVTVVDLKVTAVESDYDNFYEVVDVE